MSQQEVIANVERMLLSEKQTIKASPTVQASQEFDLNDGIVVSKSKAAAPKVEEKK